MSSSGFGSGLRDPVGSIACICMDVGAGMCAYMDAHEYTLCTPLNDLEAQLVVVWPEQQIISRFLVVNVDLYCI